MKKLLFAICLVLLVPGLSWGAVPATAVWEFQVGSTAAQVNSCIFDGNATVGGVTKGTDWSLYPTCKVSWKASGGTCAQTSASNVTNDLACTNAANSVCTGSYNFAAADVGNYINIISGTKAVAGRYEIISVAANAATMNANITDTTGDATAITANMGGACDFDGSGISEVLLLPQPLNKIFILDGDYTPGEPIVFPAGTDNNPIWITGYKTTRTTANTDAVGNDRPLLTMETSLFTQGAYNIFKNIRVTGANTTNLIAGGAYSIMMNCRLENTGAYIVISPSTAGYINNCEIISNNGICITATGGYFAINNYVHGCSVGIRVGASPVVIGNIISKCTTSGIAGAATTARDDALIYGNTIYCGNIASTKGVDTGTSNDRWFIRNNIIADCGTGVAGTGNPIHEDYNVFAKNDDYATFAVGPHSVAQDSLTGVEASSGGFDTGDFSIGTVPKAKGFPAGGYFNGLSAAAGYTDAGAIQRVEPTGGGSSAWAH